MYNSQYNNGYGQPMYANAYCQGMNPYVQQAMQQQAMQQQMSQYGYGQQPQMTEQQYIQNNRQQFIEQNSMVNMYGTGYEQYSPYLSQCLEADYENQFRQYEQEQQMEYQKQLQLQMQRQQEQIMQEHMQRMNAYQQTQQSDDGYRPVQYTPPTFKPYDPVERLKQGKFKTTVRIDTSKYIYDQATPEEIEHLKATMDPQELAEFENIIRAQVAERQAQMQQPQVQNNVPVVTPAEENALKKLKKAEALLEQARANGDEARCLDLIETIEIHHRNIKAAREGVQQKAMFDAMGMPEQQQQQIRIEQRNQAIKEQSVRSQEYARQQAIIQQAKAKQQAIAANRQPVQQMQQQNNQPMQQPVQQNNQPIYNNTIQQPLMMNGYGGYGEMGTSVAPPAPMTFNRASLGVSPYYGEHNSYIYRTGMGQRLLQQQMFSDGIRVHSNIGATRLMDKPPEMQYYNNQQFYAEQQQQMQNQLAFLRSCQAKAFAYDGITDYTQEDIDKALGLIQPEPVKPTEEDLEYAEYLRMLTLHNNFTYNPCKIDPYAAEKAHHARVSAEYKRLMPDDISPRDYGIRIGEMNLADDLMRAKLNNRKAKIKFNNMDYVQLVNNNKTEGSLFNKLDGFNQSSVNIDGNKVEDITSRRNTFFGNLNKYGKRGVM